MKSCIVKDYFGTHFVKMTNISAYEINCYFSFEKIWNVYTLLDNIYAKFYDGMLIRSPNKNIFSVIRN